MTEDKIVKEEHINDMGKWVVYEDLTMDLIEPSYSWNKRKEEMEKEALLPTPPSELEVVQEDVVMLAETVSIVLENNDIIAEDVAYAIDDTVSIAKTLSIVLDELKSVKDELVILKGGAV